MAKPDRGGRLRALGRDYLLGTDQLCRYLLPLRASLNGARQYDRDRGEDHRSFLHDRACSGFLAAILVVCTDPVAG